MSNCEEYNKKLQLLDKLLSDVLSERHHLNDCSQDSGLLKKIALILTKIDYAFGENNRTISRVLTPEKERFFSYMTNPYYGESKPDIIDFIKKNFVNCKKIKIYDLYFMGAKAKFREKYLSFIEELAGAFYELGIAEVEVFHHSGEQHVINEVSQIFQDKKLQISASIKLQDHLHDRIWVGYLAETVDPLAAVYFGSSFNTFFAKPMIYNQLTKEETETFTSIIKGLA